MLVLSREPREDNHFTQWNELSDRLASVGQSSVPPFRRGPNLVSMPTSDSNQAALIHFRMAAGFQIKTSRLNLVDWFSKEGHKLLDGMFSSKQGSSFGVKHLLN
ncbi:hypothetical protein CEXT_385721 [Caerostris extrusa]|uniref:Uncharacterized protein n=1 Tax=Caerostris extrusa TaxID=172846 RepID=A0AAV4WFA3_CAEEX|nr:hypothetical protein CEXT_385721 [Caerostris extrusa]